METLDNQVIYKLAQIETNVGEIKSGMLALVTRLESRINENHAEINSDRIALEKRVDANEKLLATLHKWKEGWTVRTTWTLGALSVLWLFIGEPIQQKVGAFLH